MTLLARISKANAGGKPFQKGRVAWNKGLKVNEQDPVDFLTTELGGTGTLISAGYITQQDYNAQLIGPKAVKVYDEMRKSDATVRASLLAITLPILSAKWYVEPYSDSEEDKAIAEFIEWNLFEGMTITWNDFMRQAITLMLAYGRMVFEICYPFDEEGNLILDDEGRVCWKKLAPRLPHTIYRWNTDIMNNTQKGIVQYLPNGKYAEIPMEKLVIFVNEKEGDNWEGFSVLRSAYKHWYIKDTLYKIDAIAHERQGTGIFKGRLPDGASPAEVSWMKTLLQQTRTNERRELTLRGKEMDVEVLDMKAGSTTNRMESILHHDRQIMKNVLAMGLDLGSGSTGSFALAASHQETLMQSIVAYARNFANTLNRFAIQRLVDVNFPDAEGYPELCFSDLDNTAFQDLAAAISQLSASGFLTPDEPTEKRIRDLMDLPEKPEPDPLDEITKALDEPIPDEVPTDMAPEETNVPDTGQAPDTSNQELETPSAAIAPHPLTKDELALRAKKGWEKRQRAQPKPEPTTKTKKAIDPAAKEFGGRQKKALDLEKSKLQDKLDTMKLDVLRRKAAGEKITPEDGAKMQLEIETMKIEYRKRVDAIKAKKYSKGKEFHDRNVGSIDDALLKIAELSDVIESALGTN